MIRGQSDPYHWFDRDSIFVASRRSSDSNDDALQHPCRSGLSRPLVAATARQPIGRGPDNGDTGTGPTHRLTPTVHEARITVTRRTARVGDIPHRSAAERHGAPSQ